MGKAILKGATLDSGTTVSVDGVALLIGYRLSVSSMKYAVRKERCIRVWNEIPYLVRVSTSNLPIFCGRAPPVTYNSISHRPSIGPVAFSVYGHEVNSWL